MQAHLWSHFTVLASLHVSPVPAYDLVGSLPLPSPFPQALLLRNEEEDHIWVDATLVEFANQMKLEHANISSIIGMCTEMEPFYIIYEYLDKVRRDPKIM